MEYLSADHPDLTTKLWCTATRSTAHPPSPELIAGNLVDRAPQIKRKTKSSRQMWPETELVGVEFEQDSPYLNGTIKSREVELRFNEFDGFETAYTTVAEWCEGTPIEVPPKNDFLVRAATLQLDTETHALALDTTKYEVQTPSGGMTYDAAGITGEYDAYQGWVSLFLGDGNKQPRQDVRTHITEFLADDYVIVIPSDEIEDKFDSSEGPRGD